MEPGERRPDYRLITRIGDLALRINPEKDRTASPATCRITYERARRSWHRCLSISARRNQPPPDLAAKRLREALSVLGVPE
jgi:hypothetical protein